MVGLGQPVCNALARDNKLAVTTVVSRGEQRRFNPEMRLPRRHIRFVVVQEQRLAKHLGDVAQILGLLSASGS